MAARCLKTLTPNDATVLEETGEGPELMEAWMDSDTVIILEAVFSGTRPGTIYRGIGTMSVSSMASDQRFLSSPRVRSIASSVINMLVIEAWYPM